MDVSEDTSLSEFAGNEADESVAGDGTDEESNEAEIEPARATYDWTPGGAACECCGTPVEKRWRSDDGMVCTDCKEW